MARNSRKHDRKAEGIRLADIDIPESTPTDDAHSLQERAVLVRCPVGRWTGSGKDEAVTEELRQKHGAHGEVGTFTKRYMDKTVLARIRKAISSARSFHKQITLPWGDSGARLLPITSFFEYKKKMTAFEQEFNLAVDEFIAEWDKHVIKQRERLGGMWKAGDYPSAEIVRASYRFAVIVEPIPSSGDFRLALSKVEAQEIRQQYDAEVKSRMKDAVHEVFADVHKVVEELRDKLADPNASIRSASFGSLRRLVAGLPKLNSVVRDPAIKELGDTIASELLNLNTDSVAHSPSTRRTAKSKADAILAALKPLQSNWTSTGAQ